MDTEQLKELYATGECSKCKLTKKASEFRKDKNRARGFDAYCKQCRLEESRTIEGVISKIYLNQIHNSKARGHISPSYTKEQLRVWLMVSQSKFIELFDAWVLSGYKSSLKPSVDRLDDYKGYSLDNIQIMTWAENKSKGNLDAKEGRNNKHNKAVRQYTLDGIFIEEFHSSQEASRQLGINQSNISACCTGRYKTAGGFLWEHA